MKAKQVKPTTEHFKTPECYRGGNCTHCGREIAEYRAGVRLHRKMFCDYKCMYEHNKLHERKEHY